MEIVLEVPEHPALETGFNSNMEEYEQIYAQIKQEILFFLHQEMVY